MIDRIPSRISLLFAAVIAVAAPSYCLQIERVSVDDAGNEGNDSCSWPSISADGRYVAFESSADNLVSGDSNASSDIFVYDRQLDLVQRVSVDNSGNGGNAPSACPRINADGRYVAFHSEADNLVPGDMNIRGDVFVYDLLSSTIERISVDSLGVEGNDRSYSSDTSADGRYVAFLSSASNLVSGDTNPSVDVFVHDRTTGNTERASVDSLGNQSFGACGLMTIRPTMVAINGNGRYVAFETCLFSLVSGDTNFAKDIFVRDRFMGITERVSVDDLGNEGNGQSADVSISDDGRYVAFGSVASNLVPTDGNVTGDAFVYDRQSDKVDRISVSEAGDEGNNSSWCPSISADGRYTVFGSGADNLVVGDSNGLGDVFLHNRLTGVLQRVSVASTGDEGNGNSWFPHLSADGSCVAFCSSADNLVPGDTNATSDIFVVWDYLPTPAPTPVPPEYEELFISRNIFNPAMGETVEIRWAVLGAQEMFLGVYNTAGELVRKLEGQGVNPVGLTRTTEWDGRNDAGDLVASGVYIIHLKGSKSFSGKIVVIK